jgi:pyridoxamine 5'-phosphate oxidase family protein
MSAFTQAELRYLGERRLARLATVSKDGTPHVTPVGFSHNPDHDSIDIGGFELEQTKKYRDIQRTGRAAVVIDDNPSVDPWRVRGIEIRGPAEALVRPQPSSVSTPNGSSRGASTRLGQLTRTHDHIPRRPPLKPDTKDFGDADEKGCSADVRIRRRLRCKLSGRARREPARG